MGRLIEIIVHFIREHFIFEFQFANRVEFYIKVLDAQYCSVLNCINVDASNILAGNISLQ